MDNEKDNLDNIEKKAENIINYLVNEIKLFTNEHNFDSHTIITKIEELIEK